MAKWDTGDNSLYGVVSIGLEFTRDTAIPANKLPHAVTFHSTDTNVFNVLSILTSEIFATTPLISQWADQEASMSITVICTLVDAIGKPLWVQSMASIGIMEMATSLSGEDRRKARTQLAIDDLSVETANAIASRIAIQQFSKSISLM